MIRGREAATLRHHMRFFLASSIFAVVLGSAAGTVQASSDDRPPQALEKARYSTLAKFDPAMRMALTVENQSADVIASLRGALTEAQLADLRDAGLTVYRADERSLHAGGTPAVLLELARLPEVERISLSRRMRLQEKGEENAGEPGE